MDDLFVSRAWMAGVVGLMIVYGIFAVVGLSRQK